MKEYTLTLTSKGQVTLPVAVRRSLGVPDAGGVLRLQFNEVSGRALIEKPTDFASLQAKAQAFIGKGTAPLGNPRELYENRRELR